MRTYAELPGFEHLYLEDSWVLAVEHRPAELRFDIEAVLMESHPEWAPPKRDEQYSYCRAAIVFRNPRAVKWVQRMEGPPAVDASGEVDYGNIDVFEWDGSSFELQGDWGHVRIEGDAPVVVQTG